MSKIINCTSYKTAFESVSEALDIDIDSLKGIMKSIGPFHPIDYPDEHIQERVFSKIPPPKFPIQSYWFHASRVIDPSRFWKEGIHKKSKMYKELLFLLSDKVVEYGLEKSGNYPNSISASTKYEISDEGPHAFLFKSLAIAPPQGTHKYSQAPELIEDISGSILGANYQMLVDIYHDISIPCVVTFRAEAGDWEVKRALWYIYLVNTGADEAEAADIAKWCYIGDGKGIIPENIVNVEILQE